MDKNKRLYKSSTDKKIDGVCAGIAEYFEMDPTVIRLLWLIATAFAGSGVFAYIIAMVVLPTKPDDLDGISQNSSGDQDNTNK